MARLATAVHLCLSLTHRRMSTMTRRWRSWTRLLLVHTRFDTRPISLTPCCSLRCRWTRTSSLRCSFTKSTACQMITRSVFDCPIFLKYPVTQIFSLVERQDQIHMRAEEDLAEAKLKSDIHMSYHLTSIYDHSIFEAFSKVVQKLIPTQMGTLESLLDLLLSVCSPLSFWLLCECLFPRDWIFIIVDVVSVSLFVFASFFLLFFFVIRAAALRKHSWSTWSASCISLQTPLPLTFRSMSCVPTWLTWLSISAAFTAQRTRRTRWLMTNTLALSFACQTVIYFFVLLLIIVISTYNKRRLFIYLPHAWYFSTSFV